MKTLTIEDVTTVDTTPAPRAKGGYVIDDKGAIYSLKRLCCHGMVLAMLHPELATDLGLDIPVPENARGNDYQMFDLHYPDLPAIRIGVSISGVPYVRGPLRKMSREQCIALRLTLVELANQLAGLNTRIVTEDHGLPTIRKLLSTLPDASDLNT